MIEVTQSSFFFYSLEKIPYLPNKYCIDILLVTLCEVTLSIQQKKKVKKKQKTEKKIDGERKKEKKKWSMKRGQKENKTCSKVGYK